MLHMEKSKGINDKYTTIYKLSADGEQYYINVRPSQLFLFIPAPTYLPCPEDKGGLCLSKVHKISLIK